MKDERYICILYSFVEPYARTCIAQIRSCIEVGLLLTVFVERRLLRAEVADARVRFTVKVTNARVRFTA